MKLKDIGERKAIEIIEKIIGSKSEIGDDCAKIDIGDKFLLLTTDMITESTHIPKNTTPWQIGWFIVATNLSDIAAKGGTPLGVLISLGLPTEYPISDFKELINGMNDCADKYNTKIIGGDTKENENLTISGTAIGMILKNEFMSRIGAKVGDLVAVTGNLGSPAACFFGNKNNQTKNDSVNIKTLMKINPRIQEGVALSKSGAVTSSMDISDGLASSIYQLSKLNNKGFEIDFEKIPFLEKTKEIACNLNLKIEDLILYFGGDYELLVTIKPELSEKAISCLDEIGCKLTIIGKVTNRENLLFKENNYEKLENRGYEHLR